MYSPSYATTDSAGRTATLFGQVMWLVAATAGCFALGCYIGRNLTPGWSILWFIAGFGCLIAMRFTVKSQSQGASIGLLAGVGVFLGLAMGPTVAYYSAASPSAVWKAAGATALFIAGFGSAGYASRRDLSALGRISFFALIALILFGIVLIFVHIPGADLLYSILGLLIFAGLTMFDFQRLRRTQGLDAAPFIAASIFLDALNVFLFFLRIFGGGRE
ncbi:MAG TPA: Bax inhibitor-1 family protein [Streptosporangiaceae bacterium]|nr:Bax inhibitor-1 family protein [Streptosporangiaceae bacterium]